MKYIEYANILENRKLTGDIYQCTFKVPNIAACSLPGQFVNIYLNEGEMLLPRPISICGAEEDRITIAYQVVGSGTEAMRSMKTGDSIKIMGPIGNGFDTSLEGRHILVGGGMGIAPLLFLAGRIKGDCRIFLGFRSETFMLDEFHKTGKEIYVSTDDGSFGYHGTVVDLLKSKDGKADFYYTCGPSVMMKAVSEYADEKALVFVSMEERMACGVGACLGCVKKIKSEDGVKNLRVCSDGPVFNGREVVWP